MQHGGGYWRRCAGVEGDAGAADEAGGIPTGKAGKHVTERQHTDPMKVEVQADPVEPEPFCLSGERCDNEVAQWDSMLDEAKAGAGQCRTCPAVN